jgi:glycyl-tRNA synthetase
MDEVGTPFCITIDTQTLQDETVTIRERDTMEQVRISISGLLNYLSDKLR